MKMYVINLWMMHDMHDDEHNNYVYDILGKYKKNKKMHDMHNMHDPICHEYEIKCMTCTTLLEMHSM